MLRHIFTNPEWRPWWEVKPGPTRALRWVLTGFLGGTVSLIAAVVLIFVWAFTANPVLLTVDRWLQRAGYGFLAVTVAAAIRACRRRKGAYRPPADDI